MGLTNLDQYNSKKHRHDLDSCIHRLHSHKLTELKQQHYW